MHGRPVIQRRPRWAEFHGTRQATRMDKGTELAGGNSTVNSRAMEPRLAGQLRRLRAILERSMGRVLSIPALDLTPPSLHCLPHLLSGPLGVDQ